MNFFSELRRRNVFKVAFAYFIVSWLLLQVSDTLVPALRLPEWFHSGVAFVLIIGFPVVIIFAWAFEMTPDGLKKEKDVDRSQSITSNTGRKLDFAIIGVLVLAVGYFVWESRFEGSELGSGSISPQSSQSTAPTDAGKLTPSPSPTKDNSIAVLPFANRSRSEDDAFFSDGIHDDLLTQLAKISGLKVISRISVMKYKNTEKTIPEIAAELGVSTILEGGIQRAGKRIRINAQLIDVANDHHIWAETFDREMTVENIFDIQSEITRQIVNAVRGQLTETEQRALARVPTQNLEAYEAYLQARTLLTRADYSQDNYIEAQPWAERAVALDPEFAQAWAILTQIHGQASWIGYDSSPARHAAARHARDMAVRHGPDLPSTLAAQAAYLYRMESDFSASLEAYQAAHQALPGDVGIIENMAMAQRRMGLWEDAIDSFETIMQLDPTNSSAPTAMISTLALMQQWQRAIPLIDEWTLKFPDARNLRAEKANALIYEYGDLAGARVLLDNMLPRVSNKYIILAIGLPLLERDFPAAIAIWDQPVIRTMADNRGWLGWRDLNRAIAYQALGNSEKARTHLQNTIELITGAEVTGTASDAFELETLAAAYALLGENQLALDTSREGLAMMPEDKDRINGTVIATQHAFVLALTGNREQALAEIERLLDQPAGFQRWALYLDPAWDFFRDDERFNALIRPRNLQENGQ